MVAKCVNPVCGTSFKYLGTGKLFLGEQEPPFNMPPQRDLITRCYWLCSECAGKYTLTLLNTEPVLTPLYGESDSTAA